MTVQTAKQILLERGRGYLNRGKYPQIVVFTKSLTEIDKLEAVYGGNHYKHNTGYIWVVSRRENINNILWLLSPNVSANGFEDVVGPYLRRRA